MKEARLLSERASERVLHFRKGGKDLFVEGSSNFGVVAKLRRRGGKAGSQPVCSCMYESPSDIT